MAAGLLYFPGAMPSLDRNGRAVAARLRFYAPDTSDPKAVYTAGDLAVVHPIPLESDSAGRFPQIWADAEESFTVVWEADDGQSRTLSDVTPAVSANAAVLEATEQARDEAQAAVEDFIADFGDLEAAIEEAADEADAAADSAGAAAGSATAAAGSAMASSGSASAAAGSASAAQTARLGAEAARDEAESIVGGNFAPTSRTVSAAGLATGGGDLTADRTITVPAASQAEAEAGSDNAKAMTPLRTAQAVAALTPLTGYLAPLFFGDGSDGDVTVSAPVTLSRDMYYANLTLTSGAAIDTNGYRVFVRDVLDLTNAPAGALRCDGNAGGAASGATGGSGGAARTGNTVGGSTAGTGGANGRQGDTGLPASGNPTAADNGGAGGGGGNGGTGTNYDDPSATPMPGGASSSSPASTPALPRSATVNLFRSIVSTQLATGGGGGRGGASGGGENYTAGSTSQGGGGGGGGGGAGVLAVYARMIARGGGTAAGAIRAIGGNGGVGGLGQGDVAATGGGQGGGGGGGGWIYVLLLERSGSEATNAIEVSGGSGGAGGSGNGITGYGVSSKGGGSGGTGSAGRVTLVDLGAGMMAETLGPTGTVGTTASGIATGASAQVASPSGVNL